MLAITDRLPHERLRLGAVAADGVVAASVPAGFEAHLAALLTARAGALPDALDARRLAVRAALRHGAFRPTGRAKPASEYLLRAAAEGVFPRVNGPVDVGNAISLGALVPVSLWDADLAGDDAVAFRVGAVGEAYVFNAAGQTINLDGLVAGCRAHDDAPIVTPVKDGLATKTTGATCRVAAVVYAPRGAVTEAELEALLDGFEGWLRGCGAPGGPPVRAARGVVPRGGALALDPS